MIRHTRQRAAIEAALRQGGGPLSPQEILHRARAEVQGLGIATVYRALKDLLTEKRIVAVEVPGAPPRYEWPDSRHHHHFLCRRCDRMIDIAGCPEGIERYAPPGYTVERHELTLIGLCADCLSRRPDQRSITKAT